MLEKYLDNGDIRIGRLGEYHLSAVFVFHENRKKIVIDSQKGIDHLLKMLEVRLNKSRGRKQVEKKFPYPLFWNTATAVDRLLEYVSIHIYTEDESVCIDFYTTRTPKKSSIPGVYKISRRGLSIEKLLIQASNDLDLCWASVLPPKRQEETPY